MTPKARQALQPLNGVKTHPLSDHALWVMRNLPMPELEINHGLRNQLLREELVRTVQLPSPYKTRKGKTCAHMELLGR